MKLIVATDYAELSRLAADQVAEALRLEPELVLGIATGHTTMGLYAELVARAARGELDFSRARTFNLDEYHPIAPDHPQSFRRFVWDRFAGPVGIARGNVHVPDGLAAPPGAECARYEAALAACGGVDLQLLGIGRNGHIGFNEPGSALDSTTRCVPLSEETLRVNGRDFGATEAVPRHAITMGIGTILRARKLLLLASGPAKAEILARALHGPVTPAIPASALQRHPDVTVVADRPAAARLGQTR